ncbi:UNVERIFIED_CONTAM: hypothetical protein B566_EDAN018781 [Ephemera danica]|nr:hypothetical protein B566_EDAN018781 [Ephemera danica]
MQLPTTHIQQHVGCDGVVGSDKRWDACGECGGTNSSCRLFSGLFSNHANLQAGYNLVTTIPRGACNISVTELTPSRSYLALRRPSGSFLLNGDWQINWAGEYEAGGVTFVYRPQDAARGEALSARGPLLEPVDLMVLYQQSNLAIKYEYTLPVSAGMPSMTPVAGPAVAPSVIRPPHGVMVQPAPHHGGGHHHGGHHHGGANHQPPPAPPLLGYNPSNPDDVTVRDGPFNDGDTRRHSVAPNFPFSGTGPVGDEAQPPVAALRPRNRKVRKFVWRHVSFSECSKSCGGGMQTAAAICVREYNQAPVPEKRCQGQERPPPQMVRCNNKPCPAEWEAGEWSSCSTTCGAGIQSRSVVCRQHISASLTMKVAEGACLGPLLERTRRCQLKPCSSSGARWSVSEWGPCAAPCGKGTRSRIVRCVASDSTDLSPESCNSDERPEEQESCDAGPCSPHHMSQSGSAQWLVSEWAQRCSEECGTGVQTRRVLCSAGSEHACDAAARPEASRACSSDKQCSGKWFAGPWGQVSAQTS